MKRIVLLLLAAVMPMSLCACNNAPAKKYPLDKFDLEAYMIPYWDSKTIYQESVMLLEDENGDLPDIPLLYKAKKILSVRSSDLKTEYREGRDYRLVDGKLHIPEGSAIPTVTHDFYYPAKESETAMKLNANYGDGFIFFSEGSVMHSMQIAVTYTHKDKFDGEIPVCKGDKLPKLQEKLKNGEPLKLCIFGDSISTGANSTQKVSAMPLASTWFQMLADTLEAKYPETAVSLYNPSVGGKKSDWGVEEAERKVTYGPDLCIIGFGMNDGSAKVPAEDFLNNIQSIMKTVRSGNPDCEFVLISTMMPNAEVGKFLGKQEEYLPALMSLEEEGVVVADMTTYHKSLLAHKRYYDMSGNNVNHPNDFLARAYAHVLWQTMIGY